MEEETISVELSPSEAAAFLEALQDESEGGYRERLLQDPRTALSEHRILISDGLAARFAELPAVEDVQGVSARTPRPPAPIALPGCNGWSLLLIVGQIASLMEE